MFFHSYGDYRYLHSFPTRRSSDLKFLGFSRERWMTSNGAIQRSCSVIPSLPTTRKRRPTLWSGTPLPRGRQGDRKSTRLNSSHTVISYAVLFLKKKKNITYHTPTT